PLRLRVISLKWSTWTAREWIRYSSRKHNLFTKSHRPMKTDNFHFNEAGSRTRTIADRYRRACSRIVEASVFSSRSFTITGVHKLTPCLDAKSPVAGRAPGTTTAPQGIVRGASAVFL